MSKIVSIHSFRGGTGKSNVTANTATTLALRGERVGVVDTDIQSPGIHVIFGMSEETMDRSLNDYLWGRCEIEETAYDVSASLGLPEKQLFLIPSSIRAGEIIKILKEGYDVNLMYDGFQDLIDTLELDTLMIDTHPGLNEETLTSVALSNALIILLRPDEQDFQGTAVTVDVAQRLDVPHLYLTLNKALPSMGLDALKAQVEETYGCPVLAVLPLSEDIVRLGSAGIFCLQYPNHPFSQGIGRIADAIMQV